MGACLWTCSPREGFLKSTSAKITPLGHPKRPPNPYDLSLSFFKHYTGPSSSFSVQSTGEVHASPLLPDSFLLDSLGDWSYIPSSSRRRSRRGQTTRSFAGHTRHAHPQSRISRAAPWLRHSSAYPTNLEGPSRDSTRLAVSRAVP